MRDDPFSLVMLPSGASPDWPPLLDKSFDLATRATALGGRLHPIVRRAVGDLVRSMNCYYSNLIEGHHTLPRDIDRALKSDFVAAPRQRNLQIEAVAHIKVQAMVDGGQLDKVGIGQDLVRAIHREFCSRLPDDFLWVEAPKSKKRLRVAPGEWRTHNVAVGRHQAISPELVPAFMARFDDAYSKVGRSMMIIAAAASHHRLLWIHPFLDGNGRTARLHSHAFLRASGIGSDLWAVSRGLARTVEQYKAALAHADYPRQAEGDGRGSLSDRGLAAFINYFIEACADQVAFMDNLLEPANLLDRLGSFARIEAERGTLDPRVIEILSAMVTTGEIAKSDAPAVLGVSERHARRIVEPLLARGLVVADSKFAPYRLAFPLAETDLLFPRLFAPVQAIEAPSEGTFSPTPG